jgi:hypothetical protein
MNREQRLCPGLMGGNRKVEARRQDGETGSRAAMEGRARGG